MASTCRDRTAEFRSLTQTLKKIGGITSVNQNHADADPSTSKAPLLASSRSEITPKALQIVIGIAGIYQKIARLAEKAKSSSMFNDPIAEIQNLTGAVKDDITKLNTALTNLQALQQMEIADGIHSEDGVAHTNAVCDDLKSKLMGATKQLQNVLTTRTENIKARENRKQIYSTNASRETPFSRQEKPITEPPPWSSSANAFGSSQSSLLPPPNGIQVSNQLRRRSAVENPPSQHVEMSMLQQVVPRQEHYSQSRAVALQNVESTISELSGIFTHLATMVAHQGELAIRIDDNMDESLANVESARSALLRHLNQISSNRWLMIKIFAVIIIFLMVFIFFVA